MLAVARREAALRDIRHVTWHLGRAEAFEVLPDSFELVTIGEAFHRLEADTVARNVFLSGSGAPGCLATLGLRQPLLG